jgi:hypothetical protein
MAAIAITSRSEKPVIFRHPKQHKPNVHAPFSHANKKINNLH